MSIIVIVILETIFTVFSNKTRVFLRKMRGLNKFFGSFESVFTFFIYLFNQQSEFTIIPHLSYRNSTGIPIRIEEHSFWCVVS
jgi:hypothetical protein